MRAAATADALASTKYQKQHLKYHVLQQSSRKSRPQEDTYGSLQLFDLLRVTGKLTSQPCHLV
jgi:hypothetical protein